LIGGRASRTLAAMRGHRARHARRWALSALVAGAWLVGANEPTADVPAAPLAGASEDPGHALRAAVEAVASGDREHAGALLRAVAGRHPIIADHADLLHMRLLVDTGDLEAAIAEEPRWTDRDGPLRARFYALLGEAERARGDEEKARAALEFAAAGTRDRSRLAALDLAIAQSQLRSGAREPAAERLLAVWSRGADLPQAAQADALLAQLESELGRPLRTALPTLDRADRLFESHHNEAALAAYDRALELGLAPADRKRARQQRADTLFRLRRYDDAIDAYRKAPASIQREIQRARAMARAGRVPEGASALERLGRERRGERAVEALYLAAVLWDGEKEHARASELFEQVIRRLPRSGYAASARWSLGWAAYREGRLDEAIRQFDALSNSDPDPVSALRPRYWAIRARELQGAPNAKELYAELAREFPFTYYGWLALGRAGAPVTAKPAAVAPGSRSLRPEQLARPRILLEAGLVHEAREELAMLFGQARGLDDRLALAELCADAGDFSSAQRVVVDAYSEELARGPAPGDFELWWHAWPAPYDAELQRATRSGQPSRELVYSIMREESGYRPDVISVSGARGLLQLMPETATRVARTVQLDEFDPNDLFRPAVNIELGSAYLGQLLARFDGNAAAAIGSYNAGPEAVARWQPGGGASEDVWIEEIPYDQTRGYVKRVLRSLHVYRVLY
jgi:soluble lytic murein transglycosylase